MFSLRGEGYCSPRRVVVVIAERKSHLRGEESFSLRAAKIIDRLKSTKRYSEKFCKIT